MTLFIAIDGPIFVAMGVTHFLKLHNFVITI